MFFALREEFFGWSLAEKTLRVSHEAMVNKDPKPTHTGFVLLIG